MTEFYWMPPEEASASMGHNLDDYFNGQTCADLIEVGFGYFAMIALNGHAFRMQTAISVIVSFLMSSRMISFGDRMDAD